MNNFPNHRIASVATTLALLAFPVQGDIAEVINNDGQRMIFEYQGDQLRVNMDQQDSYMIQQGERVYMVSESNGETMVIDLKQTLSMFGNMAEAAIPDMAAVRVESLQPTGRRETVAGIDGEVYLLQYTNEEGKPAEAEMVLSSDPRAMGFRDAVHQWATSLSSMLAMQGTHNDLHSQLDTIELGVLRYGDDMRVTSIRKTRVPGERFVLPAEPTDLTGFGGLWGAGLSGDSDGSSGGFMGSILGDDPAAAREDNRREAKEEAPATDPVDNAARELGKAFGKLFGN